MLKTNVAVGGPVTPQQSHAEPKFLWPLSQERIELLANVLYEHADLVNRVHPGSTKAERAHGLVNDLRAHVVAAGAEDPFPYMNYEPAFADTPVPAWPDLRFLHFEDMEAA